MAFSRAPSVRQIVVQAPKVENKLKTFQCHTKEVFAGVNVQDNKKLQELIKLLQTHLILQEFWKIGHKWEKKERVTQIQYLVSSGQIPKERGEFILVLLKIDHD